MSRDNENVLKKRKHELHFIVMLIRNNEAVFNKKYKYVQPLK